MSSKKQSSNEAENGNKSKPLLSDVFDINGKNIKLGDKVKFWRFYKSAMSSEDQFGTEPQNSWTVYEEYMEFVTGEVVFDLGAFCVKYGKEIASLRDIIKQTPIDFIEHYMFGIGGEIYFDDDEFWGEGFTDKFPQNDEKEWTNEEHESYWNIIRNHLEKKCKEFEVVS